MEQAENKSSSPQKYTVKNRSKSTEEVQQAKKAFQTPQKSLPGKPELEDLKETPSPSTEELK